ncbi:MAG: CBS domain-containing protein [candidate division NC10 bacterium]
MLVKDRMKRDPVTVKKDDSFRYALKLIRKEGIRHLPVLDGKKLVGIVTDSDLRQAAPSPATSLEVHELNYLLERLKIEAIMTKKVITVAPDTNLLEAAKLLLAHKVGCLPVVEQRTSSGSSPRGTCSGHSWSCKSGWRVCQLPNSSSRIAPAPLRRSPRPWARGRRRWSPARWFARENAAPSF